jgi:copper chaperone CopZ
MITTTIFTITGMHCTSCAMNIDGELEDTGKIKDVKTNYAKATTEVTFDREHISEEEIIETIKKAGYDAIVKQ